jgi:hypothetical protein
MGHHGNHTGFGMRHKGNHTGSMKGHHHGNHTGFGKGHHKGNGTFGQWNKGNNGNGPKNVKDFKVENDKSNGSDKNNNQNKH